MGSGSTVIDFRPFWGDFLHMEQEHQMLELANQENKADEGTYLVFYNIHEDLPPNKHISGILGTAIKGSLADRKLFWRGDVFVVRFQENSSAGGTYMSLRPTARMNRPMEAYIRDIWDRDGLEEHLKSARAAEEAIEKMRRDRELLRARL